MTTIIGIRHNGGVLMAADRQVSGWYQKNTLLHAKMFEAKGILFGITGTVRIQQLIQYHLTLRPMYVDEQPLAYLSGALCTALRELMEQHKVVEDETPYGGLLALNGELFSFTGSGGGVTQSVFGYEAHGSGYDVARGALAATEVILDLDVRAQRVMEIAARHDLYTSAPFDIMRQEKPE